MLKAVFIAISGFASIAGHAQLLPQMVSVTGDTFLMGSESGQDAAPDGSTHKVVLSGFKIAKTEVTVAQWKHYCAATANPMPTETPSWGWIDSHPMVNISWYDAVAYCEWLSVETGKKYRLPTEAEWEFAAKGGSQTKSYNFSGGKGMELTGWCSANSSGSTQPVAAKRPNELGLYDMSGNVYEWCLDKYGNYPGSMTINPKGPSSGNMRVYRGGSWYSQAMYCDVVTRENNDPKNGYPFVGFRPVEEEEDTIVQQSQAVAVRPKGTN